MDVHVGFESFSEEHIFLAGQKDGLQSETAAVEKDGMPFVPEYILHEIPGADPLAPYFLLSGRAGAQMGSCRALFPWVCAEIFEQEMIRPAKEIRWELPLE